ncbi:MAG: hypothetical protein ABIY52_11425 [Gemmatimonadaceae bacterium]
MRAFEVAEISIDDNGRLLIRPREFDASFPFVLRAAAEVNWDAASASFECPKPREWTYLQWFQRARSVVRSELGHELQVNDRTTWTNIPDALREAIMRD